MSQLEGQFQETVAKLNATIEAIDALKDRTSGSRKRTGAESTSLKSPFGRAGADEAPIQTRSASTGYAQAAAARERLSRLRDQRQAGVDLDCVEGFSLPGSVPVEEHLELPKREASLGSELLTQRALAMQQLPLQEAQAQLQSCREQKEKLCATEANLREELAMQKVIMTCEQSRWRAREAQLEAEVETLRCDQEAIQKKAAAAVDAIHARAAAAEKSYASREALLQAELTTQQRMMTSEQRRARSLEAQLQVQLETLQDLEVQQKQADSAESAFCSREALLQAELATQKTMLASEQSRFRGLEVRLREEIKTLQTDLQAGRRDVADESSREAVLQAELAAQKRVLAREQGRFQSVEAQLRQELKALQSDLEERRTAEDSLRSQEAMLQSEVLALRSHVAVADLGGPQAREDLPHEEVLRREQVWLKQQLACAEDCAKNAAAAEAQLQHCREVLLGPSEAEAFFETERVRLEAQVASAEIVAAAEHQCVLALQAQLEETIATLQGADEALQPQNALVGKIAAMAMERCALAEEVAACQQAMVEQEAALKADKVRLQYELALSQSARLAAEEFARIHEEEARQVRVELQKIQSS